MPNTFAMAPGYVSRYIKAHGLRPPKVDPLDLLERRLENLDFPGPQYRRGRAWMHDVTKGRSWRENSERAKLVFTSPPYLEVIKYGKYNWIRLWMLGAEPKQVDNQLFTTSSLTKYLAFMHRSIRMIRTVLREDGYACLVIGDVRRGERHLNLAREVERTCVPGSGLEAIGVVTDRVPVQHKVSRIWGDNRGRATKTDRILILAAPQASEPGSLQRISWRGE
jgi:site-specific DNA-methyltransferase (adenine-specific)